MNLYKASPRRPVCALGACCDPQTNPNERTLDHAPPHPVPDSEGDFRPAGHAEADRAEFDRVAVVQPGVPHRPAVDADAGPAVPVLDAEDAVLKAQLGVQPADGRVDQADVGEGHWEITRLTTHISGRALFFATITQQQDETMSDFREVPAGTNLAKAAELLKEIPAVASLQKH